MVIIGILLYLANKINTIILLVKQIQRLQTNKEQQKHLKFKEIEKHVACENIVRNCVINSAILL